MSWCDKLASTPIVGFRLKAHFAPREVLLNAFAPIFDRATETEAKHFTIEPPTTPFTASFTTNDGFRYYCDEAKLAVGFHHRAKYRLVSGGPPIMEMLSEPAPFTKLFTKVAQRLVEATLLLPNIENRLIKRVGIVSVTPIAEEDMPPGIKKLVEYIGRPWAGALNSFNINITSDLSKSKDFTDHCQHVVIKSDDKDELMTLQFDWHRTFETEQEAAARNLDYIIKDAKNAALEYFEDLAEGNRFDEDVLRAVKP